MNWKLLDPKEIKPLNIASYNYINHGTEIKFKEMTKQRKNLVTYTNMKIEPMKNNLIMLGRDENNIISNNLYSKEMFPKIQK